MNRGCRILVAWLLTLPAVAGADPLTPFQRGSSEVTLEDAMPHYDAPENRSNEFYSEWWSFVYALDNGYWAYIQFLVSNMGPGDGKGAVTAEFRLPDGQKFSERTDFEDGQWKSAKDRFELTFGENTLSGPLDALKIHVKNPSFEADFQLKNVAPPWKPGTGKAQYGTSSGRYYQIQLLAPIAQIEGTVTLEGDPTPHKVKGLVHADHQIASIGMQEQAKRWARFRTMNDKTALFLANLQTPDTYGNAPVRYAVLFQDGKKVFESEDFELKEADLYEDPKKAGYSAPRLLQFQGTSDAGTFRGAIKSTKQTDREDFLETSGAATRFIVSKFAKPIMYQYDAAFAVELTPPDAKAGPKKQEYKGKGRYYFTVVNP